MFVCVAGLTLVVVLTVLEFALRPRRRVMSVGLVVLVSTILFWCLICMVVAVGTSFEGVGCSGGVIEEAGVSGVLGVGDLENAGVFGVSGVSGVCA